MAKIHRLDVGRLEEAMRLAEEGEAGELVRLRKENAVLCDLIAWIAPRIERRNGNGAVSDKHCLICVMGQPVYRRQGCRHGDIWAIAKESA